LLVAAVNRYVPSSGCKNPSKTANSVDFPDPDGPVTTTKSPLDAVKDKPSNTTGASGRYPTVMSSRCSVSIPVSVTSSTSTQSAPGVVFPCNKGKSLDN